MPLDFFVWLAIFILTIIAAGFLIYSLICLSDLETDYMNVHEAARAMNGSIWPEMGSQGLIPILCVIRGLWITAALHSILVAYHYRLIQTKAHMVDVTEMFNHLANEKRRRICKLLAYAGLFSFAVVRLVQSSIQLVIETHSSAPE